VPDGTPPAPQVQLRNAAAFTRVTGFTVRARGHSGFAGTARASRIALHIGQPASFCANPLPAPIRSQGCRCAAVVTRNPLKINYNILNSASPDHRHKPDETARSSADSGAERPDLYTQLVIAEVPPARA